MTLAGMPALHPSTPRREGRRAFLVALLALAGGLAWTVAEAALPLTYSPLQVFWAADLQVTAPRAWGLEPETWGGLAAVRQALVGAGVGWQLALRALAGLLIAAGALAVLHPAAFERPASYYLSLPRRAAAYVSALVIGFGAPISVGHLTAALTPDVTARGAPDPGSAIRLALLFVAFCAPLWTIAGPGVLNVRAAVRLVHGAVVGLSTWAAICLGVLLAGATSDVVELLAIGNVFAAVDAARGSPGATLSWLVAVTALLHGLALALAGAVAVVGGPQSVGPRARSGAAAAAGAALALLLLAGWGVAASGRSRVREAAPDVVAALGLDVTGPSRPMVLLLGEAAGSRRVPRRQALEPQQLASDCVPGPEHRDRVLPAASEANLERLTAWLASHRGEVSGLAARVVGCRTAMLARLFRPDEARAQVFHDPEPARVGFFGFRFAVQGVLDHPSDPGMAAFARALEDTARWRLTRPAADTLRSRRAVGAAPAEATVTGRLAAPTPERWRVALVAGAAPGADPWLVAPRSDGLALRYVARATQPDGGGAFAFERVAQGTWQLALLAPEGTDPSRLTALSVSGDPGQFVVAAAGRRDLGLIRLSY